MSTEVYQRLTEALAERYRVDRELGAGGMATVFLAHDLRHDHDVAINGLLYYVMAIVAVNWGAGVRSRLAMSERTR